MPEVFRKAGTRQIISLAEKGSAFSESYLEVDIPDLSDFSVSFLTDGPWMPTHPVADFKPYLGWPAQHSAGREVWIEGKGESAQGYASPKGYPSETA